MNDNRSVTPLFDFNQPLQLTAVIGGLRGTAEPFTESWAEVFKVREAASKAKAPAVIPATFTAESLVWTKSGRPKKDQAESCTALFFDFDECELEEGDVEDALNKLGLAGTFWSTWKATVTNPRWRIAIPLAHPILPAAQEKVWKAVARALQEILEVDLDWAARHVTQPAILPCHPKPEDMQAAGEHKTDRWGWVKPNIIHVDGRPVVPEEVERAKSSMHYGRKLSFIQARRDGARCRKPPRVPTPYQGSSDAPGAAETVAAWRANRSATFGLTTGLDAVERVRRQGLGARPGGRGSVIAAGCFHLYRCGASVDEIRTWGMAALTATGGRDPAANLLKDVQEQVRDFTTRAKHSASAEWLTSAHAVLRDTPGLHDNQREALALFVTIISRAKHLQREGGGQMDWAAVSHVVGMPTTNVVSWRKTLENNGLLSNWGSGRSTHYAIAKAG